MVNASSVSTMRTRWDGKPRPAQDHKHRLRTVRPYDYKTAAGLVADFWTEVEAVMREKGVWS